MILPMLLAVSSTHVACSLTLWNFISLEITDVFLSESLGCWERRDCTVISHGIIEQSRLMKSSLSAIILPMRKWGYHLRLKAPV